MAITEEPSVRDAAKGEARPAGDNCPKSKKPTANEMTKLDDQDILEAKLDEDLDVVLESRIQELDGSGTKLVEFTQEKATQEIVKKPFKSTIVWKNLIGFVILHLCMLYGFYLAFTGQVKTPTLIFSFFLSLFAGVCVTMGAHRLWSHRSFKATTPLKVILLIGHTIAGQNCLWVWVRDHRQHHKYSDTDADPHNSTRGFWFSHLGWLMMKKHPDVIAKGKLIDMSDLEADKLIMLQKKYYKTLYLIFAFILPIAIPCLCWGETLHSSLFAAYFGRYMFGINATWSVNSVAHLWGTRPYTKHIAPVESNFVAFVAAGEGWHNYHHTFPWDCDAAEYGKHFNLTSGILRLCEKLGMAYDLKKATPEMIKHRIEKYGDGTWTPIPTKEA